MYWLTWLLILGLANSFHTQIQSDPKRDSDGDLLPDGAIYRLGSKQYQFPVYVRTYQATPDSRFLLGAGNEEFLWMELASGKISQRLRYSEIDPSVTNVDSWAIHPDGEQIALMVMRKDQYTLDIWNLKSKKVIVSNKELSDVHSMLWTPDGSKLVLACYGEKSEFHVYTSKGKLKALIPILPHLRFDSTYEFQTNNNALVLLRYDEITLYELESGNPIWWRKGLSDNANAYFLLNESELLYSHRGRIGFYDLTCGALKRSIRVDTSTDEYNKFYYSKDGSGIVVNSKHWQSIDLATGKTLSTKVWKTRFHTTLLLDKKTLLLQANGIFCLANAETGQIIKRIEHFSKDINVVSSRKGGLFAILCSATSQWNLWSWATGGKIGPSSDQHRPASFSGKPLGSFHLDGSRFYLFEERKRWSEWKTQTAQQVTEYPIDLGVDKDALYSWLTIKEQNIVLLNHEHAESAREFRLSIVDRKGKWVQRESKFNEYTNYPVPSPDGLYFAMDLDDPPVLPGFFSRHKPPNRQISLRRIEHPKFCKQIPITYNKGSLSNMTWRNAIALVWSQEHVLVQTCPNAWRYSYVGPKELLLWDAQGHSIINKSLGPEKDSSVGLALDGSFLLCSHKDSLLIYEPYLLKKEIAKIPLGCAVKKFHFSLDGEYALMIMADTTILVWKVSTFQQMVEKALANELPKNWDLLFDSLSADSATAYPAMRRLSLGGSKTVEYLRKKIQPAKGLDSKWLEQLIQDLDHDRFAVREKATDQLTYLGIRLEPKLKALLQQNPSPELQIRLKKILTEIQPMHYSSEILRQLRAVQILEWINTPEAKKLLEEWAKGDEFASLTYEAKSALK